MSRNATAAQAKRAIHPGGRESSGTTVRPRLRAHHGHCVVCGAEGTSPLDYICSDCGDPLGVTLYCLSCGRRLALEEGAARTFLRENGYRIGDLTGIVMKVTGCGKCMTASQRSDMTVYRLKIGR